MGELPDGTHLFPNGPEGILVRILEEWLDEWFTRAVIHYRWNYEASARWASQNIAAELMPHILRPFRPFAVRSVTQWGRRAARALAVDTAEGQASVEAMVTRVLDALESQLAVTLFSRESTVCVDAVLLGAFRAHLMADPVPRERLDGYPNIKGWISSLPEAETGSHLCDFRRPNPFASVILEEWSSEYGRFLQANLAVLTRAKRIVAMELDGREVTLLARPYSESSRQRLMAWLTGFDTHGVNVEPWLKERQLDGLYDE